MTDKFDLEDIEPVKVDHKYTTEFDPVVVDSCGYCEECGLLHDPADGDCIGCKLVKENKDLKAMTDWLKKIVVERDETIKGYRKIIRSRPL